ncbi:UNVERIFIED_CONTAM: hypothetical protein Sradi_2010500 [Sesamum radiatum]|uniref:CCHC-type domain-containing protein n=1 Tax=Sesamum radiatum TaxID=300843 RepID=A0AAW2TG23_SESRA
MDRLGSSLVLTEMEDRGQSLPQTTWAGRQEGDEMLVVGRVLTVRAFRFDVLQMTLMNIFRPIKGMSVRLLEHIRFFISFNHVVDRDRVLNGGPWFFDKNLIILQKVSIEENPKDVELNWVSFHVFIHGLPISMMMKEVAEYIENRLGIFLDSKYAQTQFQWGAKIRIRVFLDVHIPLIHALHIRSMGSDDTVLPKFTYDRLPNFCYGCGILRHIMRDCERQLEELENVNTSELSYGPWLWDTREVRFRSMVGGYSYRGGLTTSGARQIEEGWKSGPTVAGGSPTGD